MSELFVENDSVQVPVEPVKKPRKKRAPMSDEKKAEFAAKMKAAREKKKALAKQPEKPVKEKVEKVEKVEEPPASAEAPVKQKKERVLRHVPNELDSHLLLINSLKADIAELKLQQNSKKDLDEIKQLKNELKAIRSQKKKDEKVKAVVVKNPKVEEPSASARASEAARASEPVPVPVPVAKPRYSTYKKSIWSNLI